MQKIPKTTAFPFILTLISRISYTRFIFFPFARNLILQSRIYLCKVDFTFSIHQRILEAIFNLSFVRYQVLFFNNLNLQIVKVNLIDKIVLIETRFGVALELIDR